MEKENYQCIVKVCGYQKGGRLVGAIFWRGGYFPFAVFKWKENPLITGTKILHPDILGSYQQIEFYGVDTDLKAVDPVWIREVDGIEDDEESIFFDLTIYESWLRKREMEIPAILDSELFLEKLKSESKKSYFKLAQTRMTMV